MDAAAHFLLRQAALREELLQQGVIGLGDELDELLVQLLDPRGPFAGGGRLGELAALVAREGDDFTPEHVEHLVEPGPRVHRDGQGKNAVAEMLADLPQNLLEIAFVLVEGIDDDHFRDAVLRRVFPDRVGPDADAVVGVDDHQGEVTDAQRAEAFADEIRVTGAVDHVEFLVEPFEVEERGGHGNLTVLFAVVIIGNGAAGGDGAHPVDDAGAGKHGFAEHGFSRGGVSHDCEVSNLTRLVLFHRRIGSFGSSHSAVLLRPSASRTKM